METLSQNNELNQGGKHPDKHRALSESVISKLGKILGMKGSTYLVEPLKKAFPGMIGTLKKHESKRISKQTPETHHSIEQNIPKIEGTITKILELQKELGITLPEKRIRESIYFFIGNSNGNLELSNDMLLQILKMLGKRKDINFSEIKITKKIQEYEMYNFLETITERTVIENTKHIEINTLFEWGKSGELIHQVEQAENTEDVINFWAQLDEILEQQKISFRSVLGYSMSSLITRFALKCKNVSVDMILFDRLDIYLQGLETNKADNLRGDIRTHLLTEGDTHNKESIEKYILSNIEAIKDILAIDNPNYLTYLEQEEMKHKKESESLQKHNTAIQLPELFNPKIELENIRKLSAGEKQKAIRIWREKLRNQISIMAGVPDTVKKMAESYNYLQVPIPYIQESIKNTIIPQLRDLSREQRKQILFGIDKYVERKGIVHQYFENPIYKDNPKKLITEVRGIEESLIQGVITMEIDGGNFTFYVHNKDDYKLLYFRGDNELARNSPSNGGFAANWSRIPELTGTISVVNGVKKGNAYGRTSKIHETGHMDNQIIMPDYGLGDQLSRAKDEIIAFLKDGRNIEKIREYLFNSSNSAHYDYYAFMKKSDPEVYAILREAYIIELGHAIDIAERLQKARIPNYIHILAITPVRQWSNLEKLYLNK